MELEVSITFSRSVKSSAFTLKGVSVRMPASSCIQHPGVSYLLVGGGVPGKQMKTAYANTDSTQPGLSGY